MYRSRRYLKTFGISVALFFLLSVSTAVGFELPEPDHGIDEDEFGALWSGYEGDVTHGNTTNSFLARTTDFYYSSPPKAPERWNRGEVESIEGGGKSESVHPPHADLRDGDLIKDAHVTLFSVVPSTKAHYSPEEERLYVPKEGEVLGIVDYRVEPSVDSHEVSVGVDEAEGAVQGTGGFVLNYSGFSGENLTLNATVEATDRADSPMEEDETDRVVVRDEIRVSEYSFILPPSATSGVYPDGDRALFVLKTGDRFATWSSITLGDGTKIQTNWRFFSARDRSWDTMKVSSTEGTRDADETAHPLTVHAYPSRSGPYVEGNASIQNVLGDTFQPPELPRGVNVSVPNRAYQHTQGFDLRHGGDSDVVSVGGIVRGTETTPPASSRRPAVIRPTNLALSVAERTEDGVVVEASLKYDNGRPIDTRGTDEYIAVDGYGRINTELDGTTTFDVPQQSGVVRARYVPTEWVGVDSPRYSSSDVLTIRPRFDAERATGSLLRALFVVAPFLLVVYFADRAFSLGIWPPWRRI